jgi:peroxiredoxin
VQQPQPEMPVANGEAGAAAPRLHLPLFFWVLVLLSLTCIGAGVWWLLAGSATGEASAPAPVAVARTPALDFELVDLKGQQVKLSDLRGKVVLLNFWATWCPPCKAEIPDLIKFYEDFKDKDVVILGVDLTQSEKSQNAVADFLKSYGITYPVALDTDGTASKMYQVTGIPTSYIIDTQGIIRDIIVGPMDFEGMKRMLSGIN